MYKNLKYQLENSIITRADAEIFLKEKRSFFNKDWSEEKCLESVQIVYSQAKEKGITTDIFTQNVFGEDITVVLNNGVLRTSWGPHKYTLSDFGL